MQVVPTYPEMVKVVREEEALLDEKNQGSREPMKANSKVRKVSAQVAQVEKSVLEEDSDKKSEAGECFVPSIVQAVTEAVPVKLLTQVQVQARI